MSVIAAAPAQVQAMRLASESWWFDVMPANTPRLPIGFIMEKRVAMKLVKAASGKLVRVSHPTHPPRVEGPYTGVRSCASAGLPSRLA